MNEPKNLKDHQILKTTQITNKLLSSKEHKISKETQITDEDQILK
jgi:hypothetical protein